MTNGLLLTGDARRPVTVPGLVPVAENPLHRERAAVAKTEKPMHREPGGASHPALSGHRHDSKLTLKFVPHRPEIVGSGPTMTHFSSSPLQMAAPRVPIPGVTGAAMTRALRPASPGEPVVRGHAVVQDPIHRENAPGPLRNGNPRGNPNLAPRCGAKTRLGCKCKSPAMKNGRCRMHGGASTGPKTAEGKARVAAAVRGRWGNPEIRATMLRTTALLRGGRVIAAIFDTGVAIEAVAPLVRMLRGLATPEPPQSAAREWQFVQEALLLEGLTQAETRALVGLIRGAVENPIHRERSSPVRSMTARPSGMLHEEREAILHAP